MVAKKRLSRLEVVEKARSLANIDGWANLNLHRLASELGIQTPSLYNHVDGLPGLKRELALLASKELTDRILRTTVGKSGRNACVSLARAYRAYALDNPGLLMALTFSPDPRDKEHMAISKQFLETGFSILGAFSMSRGESIHALRAIRSAAHGFVTMELSGGFGLKEDIDESFERLIAAIVMSFGRGKADAGS